MAVTESQALAVISGASMKMELRIPMEISDHDDLITAQIVAAVSYVVETTGRAVDDLAELRPAVVAIVRAQYDGFPRSDARRGAQYLAGPISEHRGIDPWETL